LISAIVPSRFDARVIAELVKGLALELTAGLRCRCRRGSVGGLSFAIGAASRSLRVLVLEEDGEIGEPEKCDGLVSLRAMRRYIPPEDACIQSRVTSGVIHSPPV